MDVKKTHILSQAIQSSKVFSESTSAHAAVVRGLGPAATSFNDLIRQYQTGIDVAAFRIDISPVLKEMGRASDAIAKAMAHPAQGIVNDFMAIHTSWEARLRSSGQLAEIVRQVERAMLPHAAMLVQASLAIDEHLKKLNLNQVDLSPNSGPFCS